MQSTWMRRAPGSWCGQRWQRMVTVTACGAAALTLTGITGCGPQPGTAQPTAQVTTTTSSEVPSSPAPTSIVATPEPTMIATPAPTPVLTPAPTPVPTRVPTPVPVPPGSGAGGNAAPGPSDPYAQAKAEGASAVCADGTDSFSQHRSGTCSHHGGVHWWTGNLGPAGPGDH
jgi:Protein of unknown function (DUF3761)